jgi:ATPase family associated with various cellular activities (AAA)
VSAGHDLHAMLTRIDTAIEREVLRLRGRYQLSLDEFRGLYVSDQQVDALLIAAGADGTLMTEPLPPLRPSPRFEQLAVRFGLNATEQDILLLSLAIELDARYATLFAYLNDDAARRRANADLAVRFFGTGWDERDQIRQALSPGSPLRRCGLLAGEMTAWGSLQGEIMAAPIVIDYLLGGSAIRFARLEAKAPGPQNPDNAALVALLSGPAPQPILLLAGHGGTGRAAFAGDIAGALGLPLAVADIRGGGTDTDKAMMIDAAQLAARIDGAALLMLMPDEPSAVIAARIVPDSGPLFLAIPPRSTWQRTLARKPCIVRHFTVSAPTERREQWRRALKAESVRVSPAVTEAIAARYRISATAIRSAVRDIRLDQLASPGKIVQSDIAALSTAARRQCSIDLGHLATQVAVRPGWNDLVLPPSIKSKLRDFADAACQRDKVYGDWGMGDVGRGVGCGLIGLFAGVSGTGKTMSAAVLARETGLDIWRIDLSAVVSKYIGETEKNLNRIFDGAKSGDAILFFDEADALFGKRSEVKDAHDRYANIEVAYLLQRLEEHDGVAILASNLSRNIDQAFIRRIHYIIDFPLPDATLRERLWRRAFSDRVPIAADIDYAMLGDAYILAGGDIRAAALDAAFQAASNGGCVDMAHIVRAISRQLLKQGKLPSNGEFGSWPEVMNGHPADALQ